MLLLPSLIDSQLPSYMTPMVTWCMFSIGVKLECEATNRFCGVYFVNSPGGINFVGGSQTAHAIVSIRGKVNQRLVEDSSECRVSLFSLSEREWPLSVAGGQGMDLLQTS